jgi:GntR family transcriptional regulator
LAASSKFTLQRDSDLPLWAQVRNDVTQRLENGEFVDAFPSDRELVAQYKVSRHTVREALRELRDSGILQRHRGRGSYVEPIALEQQVGPLYSLFRSIEDQGYRQVSTVLALETVRDTQIAARLWMVPSRSLFHLRRLRLVNDTPFAVDDIWMPADLVAPLFEVDFRHTAVYAELGRLVGLQPVKGWERIHPRLPDATTRKMLGIDPTQAVFFVERYTEHAKGPLEWRETIVRGDAYTYVTNWGGGSSASQFTTR